VFRVSLLVGAFFAFALSTSAATRAQDATAPDAELKALLVKKNVQTKL
jgi:hypothetical protein